ncbi:MAG: YjjG family noncanonical pyrimidine nucleotidase [Saprospiraceae bacterium]
MKYKTLFFDADNTLWDFNLSEKFALFKVLEEEKIPYQPELLDTWHSVNKLCWLQLEEGTLAAEDLRWVRWQRFFEKLGKSGNFKDMGQRYTQHLGSTDFMIPGAKSILDKLSVQRQLVLVTNGLKEVQRRRIQNTNISNYFEAIVISDEIGVAKPHGGFFDHAFAEINNADKERTLMIGDSLNSDIQGGNNYGLSTCWFNPNNTPANSGVIPKYQIKKLEELMNLV